MDKKAVFTLSAPAAIGPYSQAVPLDHLLFVSGQLPIDMETGALISGDIAKEVRVIFRNIQAILEAADSSLDKILKVTVFVQDMSLFAALNEEYRKHFHEPFPAREVIQVAGLPKGAEVEISVIAFR